MKHNALARILCKTALAAARRTTRDGICGAVIVAAGSSTRFGTSKPLLKIGEHCVFEYSLCAFLASRYVGEIVLVVRGDDIPFFTDFLNEHYPAAPVRITKGGTTRAESAERGFRALSPRSRFVAFHDAARPLVLTPAIDRVIAAAISKGAATAACPIYDSVKRADAHGKISESIARDDLYTVSTPQVFFRDVYEIACAKAHADHFSGTDDNALCEHAGFSISLIDVAENRKLTVPSDLDVVSRILLTRAPGELL